MGKYKKLIGTICILSIFIAALVLGNMTYILAEDTTKNVLVINSYHKGLTWSDNEMQGIIDTLNKSQLPLSIAVEYMDWKNYPTNENYEQIYSRMQYKYSNKKIDIVITADDAALEFALKNREKLFSNAPVVFSGVNQKGIDKYTKDHKQVTGIAEVVEPGKTIQAALAINPNLETVYLVYDESESGRSTASIVIQEIEEVRPALKVEELTAMAFEDILTVVGQAPQNSIVLLTAYYRDAEGMTIGLENSCRRISQSAQVPTYHLYDFGLGNGALGGSVVSGRLQGEAAGQIALRIMQGEQITQLAPAGVDTTRISFDYNQFRRFQIDIRKIPEGSEILNKPFSLIQVYRNLLITALVIFILLLAFIYVLLFYIGKINKMRQELSKSHEELTHLYKELIHSDDMLKTQYEKLTQIQNELMLSQESYSILFERMLNGFFILEPVSNNQDELIDIRFLKVNPSFKTQTYQSGDIVGKTWFEVFDYPNQNLHIYRKVLETGQAVHFETYHKHTDIYYLVNAFKVAKNQVGVVFDNITQYKKAIMEVSMLNEELEERVLDRTEELQNVVQQLEAFTYTVSHDLKSPIRAIESYTRMILEDSGDKLDEETKEMLYNIKNISKDMIEMIIKLLQFSTASNSILQLEEVDMKEKVVSTFNEVKATYPDRNVKLIIDTALPVVFGDKVFLRQVINNVFTNAIKFTKLKTEAIINVGCRVAEGEYIFYIKDNGVGFNMEYADKLFDIFQRLHTSDEFEGSGIGLVTIKKVIERHGGRVWIEGMIDQGTTVYFSLPIPGNQ